MIDTSVVLISVTGAANGKLMNRSLAILATIVLIVLRLGPVNAQSPLNVATERGTSASGSRWIIDKPGDWNGTLLLWSHGWWGELRAPENAPPEMRELLLDAGYALAGSTYAAAGWALAEAVPDQLDLLEQFARRYGEPRRVVAWGNSMGGLVTTTLAERHPDAIDGAVTMCASSGGALGMLNTGLDGAFAFVTLVAPDAGIRIVATGDDFANGAKVRQALEPALATPAGRARVALASVLGGLPAWTRPGSPKPANDDYAGQVEQMAASFVTGVFLPRAEQEMRAGGVTSWNTGVDYRVQLERSGRRALVERMYALAGLELDADLERLDAAPRIAADPVAATYMMRNATPSGEIGVPVLSLHPVGDGVTSPSMQAGFIEAVKSAGNGGLVAAAWNARAGHCTSSPGEMLAAVEALQSRIETGRWSVTPAELNDRARAAGTAAPTFVEHEPAPLLRQCVDRPGRCPGYPGDE